MTTPNEKLVGKDEADNNQQELEYLYGILKNIHEMKKLERVSESLEGQISKFNHRNNTLREEYKADETKMEKQQDRLHRRKVDLEEALKYETKRTALLERRKKKKEDELVEYLRVNDALTRRSKSSFWSFFDTIRETFGCEEDKEMEMERMKTKFFEEVRNIEAVNKKKRKSMRRK